MMEKEYIQKLLDSYMAAETTKEEEQLLSDYFSTHRDIPSEWREFSVMFRSLKQYKQKPDASHRGMILKWSAAAAIITVLFGTGMLLLRQEEKTDKPSEAIAQIAESPTTNVLEAQQEVKVGKSTTTKAETRKNKQERLVRRAHKVEAQVSQTEHQPDVSLPVQNTIPTDASIRSLSSHREQMRNNLEATFEHNTIFIAQNTVEL